jgi:hypothetical protein
MSFAHVHYDTLSVRTMQIRIQPKKSNTHPLISCIQPSRHEQVHFLRLAQYPCLCRLDLNHHIELALATTLDRWLERIPGYAHLAPKGVFLHQAFVPSPHVLSPCQNHHQGRAHSHHICLGKISTTLVGHGI